jgi:hypothetical protein
MRRRKRKLIAEDKVTAADVIAFIERTCFIPEGKFVGQHLKLLLLRLIYDNPHSTRRAIVSMGRKGVIAPRTALCAVLGRRARHAGDRRRSCRCTSWRLE